MARKIFVCFFVVLLLTTLVVPAFAVSAGQDGFGVWASFPISEVYIEDGQHDGSSFTWPSNYCSDNSRFVISDFTSSASQSPFASVQTYYTNYNNEPLIESTITLPGDCNKFSFFLDTKFNMGVSGATFALPVGSAFISNIRIWGFIYEPVLVGDTYELKYTQFNREWSFPYDLEFTTFQLGTYLRSAVDRGGSAAEFCYANCRIEITLHDIYVPGGIDCFVYAHVAEDGEDPYAEPFFVQWFNFIKLKHTSTTVAPAGFFDWLLNAVNAFLNFQILPGFSMNSIFYVVLVIAVVLAVVKIMH